MINASMEKSLSFNLKIIFLMNNYNINLIWKLCGVFGGKEIKDFLKTVNRDDGGSKGFFL